MFSLELHSISLQQPVHSPFSTREHAACSRHSSSWPPSQGRAKEMRRLSRIRINRSHILLFCSVTGEYMLGQLCNMFPSQDTLHKRTGAILRTRAGTQIRGHLKASVQRDWTRRGAKMLRGIWFQSTNNSLSFMVLLK